MTLEQAIQQKKAELHSLPFYQKMVNGQLTKLEYLKYLTEIKFIHDYIDHKSNHKDHMDFVRWLRLEVDKLELAHDIFPEQVNPTGNGISENYAVFNMMSGFERANAHAYVHYKEMLEECDTLKSVVPGKGRIYVYENKSACLSYLENNKPPEEWLDECVKAYQIRIDICKKLEGTI